MGRDRGDCGDETLPADERQTLGVGSVFAGRYLIEREIGKGGMGEVFAAHDRSVDDRVALKVLRHLGSGSLERFRREVKLARHVTHRNAARTYDLGEWSGIHYLTMELVEGSSLAEQIRGGPLDPAEVAGLGAQIARGLAAAHDAGVVHRDLKPANILIDREGRAVITDFGIARSVQQDSQLTGDAASLLGTPAYMAPEQVSGRSVDHRADLYALGLVLYEALTGELPFVADTPLATAIARLDREPADLRRTRTDFPHELTSLVMACLERAPERRPASAAEIAERLAGLGGVAARGTEAPDDRSSRTRWPTLTSTAAGHGLAVLPFRYRGPAEDAYLGDVLADELVDILSMTRGLRVPATAATARFAEDRDPGRVGAELGVDTMVDGTIQRAGAMMRISARLVDVRTGYQLWSERFDGRLEDVFDLQDRMAKRVAETLRLQLETLDMRGQASPEVVELYLRARAVRERLDLGGLGPDGAICLYERCLELEPGFKPALAGYALACVHAWFLPQYQHARDWHHVATTAVEEALRLAPELAESHYAAGRLHVQLGDYREAARQLVKALEIAPTHAGAHDYLGSLQCEAGRAEEGLRHLRLARSLSPSAPGPGTWTEARIHALRGDLEAFEEAAALLARLDFGIPLQTLRLRVGFWYHDEEAVAAATTRLEQLATPQGNVVVTLGRLYGKPEQLGLLKPLFDEHFTEGVSPRFRSMALQIVAEVAGSMDATDVARSFVELAADTVLIDLEWLDRCPALACVRADPAFAGLRRKVARRAEAIWSVE